jgi:GTP-binding protein Era
VNRPNAQVVLVDTPGIRRTETVLERQMMGEVRAALEGIDIVAVVVDVTAGVTKDDRAALERVRRHPGPVFLLLNKIDRISKPALLPMLESVSHEGPFAEIIPISALTGDGIDTVLEGLVARLPAGAPYFPPDQYTDQPERFLAAEIVREKAMAATWNEVPQAVAVEVDKFEQAAKLIRISATIHVEREGQKGILIGRGGQMLKQIGTQARQELEQLLGGKVFLELHVKVDPGWRDSMRAVRRLDWRRHLEQAVDRQMSVEGTSREGRPFDKQAGGEDGTGEKATGGEE